MKRLVFHSKLAVFILFWLIRAVHAQATDCEGGVYVGKIGSVPVSMSLGTELDHGSDERRTASMYYRKNMIDMLLRQEPGQTVWQEFDGYGKPSGRVVLTCHDKQLSGEWISLDGAKRFAVSAIRSADSSYNSRRLTALKPIQALAKIEQGVKFETFNVGWPNDADAKISGILMVGTESAVAKINRLLWAELLQNAESLSDCAMEFQRRFGGGAIEGGFRQEFLYAVGGFVVVRSTYGAECGWGMNYGVTSHIYDLTRGNKVDSSQWFKSELRTLRGEEWRNTRLAAMISEAGLDQHQQDYADCFKAAEYSASEVYLDQNGFVFRASLPTPYKFCQGSLDVAVPYARARPFLSAEGKRAVKAIEQAIAKMPQPIMYRR